MAGKKLGKEEKTSERNLLYPVSLDKLWDEPRKGGG